MKIKWHLSIGLNGCDIEDEIDILDNASDEEIDEAVREAVFDRIEWSWRRPDKS